MIVAAPAMLGDGVHSGACPENIALYRIGE